MKKAFFPFIFCLIPLTVSGCFFDSDSSEQPISEISSTTSGSSSSTSEHSGDTTSIPTTIPASEPTSSQSSTSDQSTSQSSSDPISSTSTHTHVFSEPKKENEHEPTCVEEGWYDSVIYCSECGEELSRQKMTIPALNHKLVHHEGKPATCVNDGYASYDTCERCDYTTYEAIPATGHIHTSTREENVVPPTCTEEGSFDLVTYCLDDGAILSTESKTIPATDHAYKEPTYTWSEGNLTCTGYTLCMNDSSHVVNETVEAEYSVAKEPTISETGVGEYTAEFSSPVLKKQVKKIILSEIGTLDQLIFTLSNDIHGDYYSVRATSTSISGDIVIPSEYNGIPVKAIDNNGFVNCSQMTSISLGSNIMYFAYSCFNGCVSLKWNEYGGAKYLGNHDNPYAWLVRVDDKTFSEFEINSNCVGVGYEAFYRCELLESIKIPNSVKYFSSFSFNSCSSLKTISLSQNLFEIPFECFAFCKSLETIDIPDSVVSLYYGAFSGCKSLKNVHLGKNITIIGSSFLGCSSLESINIPESVKKIDFNSFSYCTSLRSIDIPDSVTTLGANAFSCCENLVFANIGDGITTIESGMFDGCKKLSRVTIGKNVQEIGSNAFRYCGCLIEVVNRSSLNVSFGEKVISSVFESNIRIDDEGFVSYFDGLDTWLVCKAGINMRVEIPNYITKIRHGAFSEDETLISINVPDSVTYIGNSSFRMCPHLIFAVIGDSVTTIGDNAFYQCNSLSSIVIGASVIEIGTDAFFECYCLVSVINKSSLDIRANNTDFGKIGLHAKQICHDESESGVTIDSNGYVTFNNGEDIWLITIEGDKTEIEIPSNITRVLACSFYGYKEAVSLHIPSSVRSVGSSAFYGCSSLKSIVIEEGVREIERQAFYGCSSLEKFEIPSSLVVIGTDAFERIGQNCYYEYENGKYLGNESNHYVVLISCLDKTCESFEINSACRVIYNHALYECTNLKRIIVPDSVVSFGALAFYGCSALTKISLSKNLRVIGGNAFRNCINLKRIDIPDGIEVIKDSAFEGCTNLRFVTIGKGLKEFGVSVFSSAYVYELRLTINSLEEYLKLGSNSLKDVIYTTYLFDASGKEIKEIVIPESITEIPQYAFYCCRLITNLYLHENITSIGTNAFGDCNNLAQIINKSSLNLKVASSDYGMVGYYAIEITSSEYTAYKRNEDENGFITLNDTYNSILVGYPTDEKDIVIPSYVTKLNSSLFKYENNLETVTIPENISEVPTSCFSNCKSLFEVTVENGLIATKSFEGCSALSKITLGSGVTSIKNDAFSKNFCLAEIVNKSSLSITKGASTFGNIAYYANQVVSDESQSRIQVDSDRFVSYNDGTDTYLVKYGGNETNVTIPSYINKIRHHAFLNKEHVESVTIPASIVALENYLFGHCFSLENINYEGTIDEWNLIEKASSWKNELKIKEINCSDGTISI